MTMDRGLRRRLELEVGALDSWRELPRDEVAAALRRWLRARVAELGATDHVALVEAVLDNVLGLGPLEQPLRDPAVTAVRVEGPRAVTVVREGREEPAGVDFDDDDHLTRVVRDVVEGADRTGALSTSVLWWHWGRLVDGSEFAVRAPPRWLGPTRVAITRPAGDRLSAGT